MNMLERAKALVAEDLWFKILALVLALITWFYVEAELREHQPPAARLPAPMAGPAIAG